MNASRLSILPAHVPSHGMTCRLHAQEHGDIIAQRELDSGLPAYRDAGCRVGVPVSKAKV